MTFENKNDKKVTLRAAQITSSFFSFFFLSTDIEMPQKFEDTRTKKRSSRGLLSPAFDAIPDPTAKRNLFPENPTCICYWILCRSLHEWIITWIVKGFNYCPHPKALPVVNIVQTKSAFVLTAPQHITIRRKGHSLS